MKKLLIANLIIAIISMVLIVLLSNRINVLNVEVSSSIKDTAINHIRIDSISLIIHEKDSIVNNIIVKKNEEISKSNSLSDSASYELFLELLSN